MVKRGCEDAGRVVKSARSDEGEGKCQVKPTRSRETLEPRWRRNTAVDSQSLTRTKAKPKNEETKSPPSLRECKAKPRDKREEQGTQRGAKSEESVERAR